MGWRDDSRLRHKPRYRDAYLLSRAETNVDAEVTFDVDQFVERIIAAEGIADRQRNAAAQRFEVGSSCFLPVIRVLSTRRASIAPLSKGRSRGFISSKERPAMFR